MIGMKILLLFSENGKIYDVLNEIDPRLNEIAQFLFLIGAMACIGALFFGFVCFTIGGNPFSSPRMKRCPQCAEFVQPMAKVCKWCGHKFG